MKLICLRFMIVMFLASLVNASTLSIDAQTPFYDLLPHSEIYIDKTRSITIADFEKNAITLSQNEKKLLGFGYAPDFDVWVKFTLTNTTDVLLEKILEYDNTITSQIEFFDPSLSTPLKEGLFYMDNERKTINPIFKISLLPHTSHTFYLKVHSYITTLIVKLNLWESERFYEKEIIHQLCLALFFGAISILAIYNLSLFFFTKDMSYFYYVLYIVGVMVHHGIYVGIANIYLLNQEWVIRLIGLSPFIVAFPIVALAFFSRSFLRIKQYPLLNKILNIYLIVFSLFLFTILLTNALHPYRNLFFISLLVYLFIVAIYAALKKNRQAYFILFGWVTILIAFFFMFLSSAGIFNIYEHVRYFVELCIVLEALIFSIALADRIKQLQKDKEIANETLIHQQKNEQQRLELKVIEKTKNLNVALDEKELLLKELNHRVKNNMQMIVSLVRLQKDEISDEKLQDILQTVYNRINAMSHLHDLLYKQETILHVNTYDYFSLLMEELEESYEKDVAIHFDIKTDLKIDQAMYCGLILNELMTNAFKYAFPNGKGSIHILLNQVKERYHLCVYDDGIGYNQNQTFHSLGLVLVETLALQQLKGEMRVDSSQGVHVEITWSVHD
ncbi:7TM diverse intracellular signaling domain-containing protein [Sulfurospirillum sp.]|uniref:7TM diverse intracellular signaling domain-containing protein n=1 Tax=Sulfurospirillum sp. TaxID=2053622 RepID=UPI002FDCBF1C